MVPLLLQFRVCVESFMLPYDGTVIKNRSHVKTELIKYNIQYIT